MIGRVTIYIIAGIVSAVFIIGSWVTTGNPEIWFLRFLSIAVAVCSVLLFIWDQWAWKWPPFQRIPSVTRDISGTWETLLESMWIDPNTGKPITPKTVYVVVRQTSSTTSLTLISNESKSKSSIARVIREDGSWLVHYVYSNEPQLDLRRRSPIHHGSGVLSITGNPVKRLAGGY